MGSFLLAPANRSDFLVQAPPPGRYLLRARRASPDDNVQDLLHPSLATPTALPALEQEAVLVLEVVSASGSDYPKTLPSGLPPYPARSAKLLAPITDDELKDGDETRHRVLVFNVNSFVVTEVYDPTSALVTGLAPTATPGPTPVPGTTTVPMTWQDTILLPPAQVDGNGNCNGEAGYVVIRHRFTDFIGQYVLHCHNLLHEDGGMMQTVQVWDGPSDWANHTKPDVPSPGVPASCILGKLT